MSETLKDQTPPADPKEGADNAGQQKSQEQQAPKAPKAPKTPPAPENPAKSLPEKSLDEVEEVVVEIGAKYNIGADGEPVEVSPKRVGVFTKAWYESLYRDDEGRTRQFKTTLRGYPVWNEAGTSYQIGPLSQE